MDTVDCAFILDNQPYLGHRFWRTNSDLTITKHSHPTIISEELRNSAHKFIGRTQAAMNAKTWLFIVIRLKGLLYVNIIRLSALKFRVHHITLAFFA